MTPATSSDEGPAREPKIVPGAIAEGFERALDALERERALERLFAYDHTLWSDSPDEIVNRLGWLTAPGDASARVAEIDGLASELASAGTRHIVLLGMGGSSLGAEAIRAIIPGAAPAPEMIVLDSTVPEQVSSVRRRIDPGTTVFVVASKSGTTAEVAALREYFWGETEATCPPAGDRFVAVTDPGSPLAELAAVQSFRARFLNPPDIGGRFSVLSLYGMVPAGLAGIPIRDLLVAGAREVDACRAASRPRRCRAVVLGALLGAAAVLGRDKLTLATSPALAAFGLWAEQLVAESTGKMGRGILPIAGEPPLPAERYGDDRIFATLRLAGDGPTPLDDIVGDLERDGHPHVDLVIETRAELGAELYRWQIATAVAGHLLGVHPFDQPDVEATKIETRHLLERLAAGEGLPDLPPEDVARELRDRLPSASYLALMGYLGASEELEEAIAELRSEIGRRHGVATTFGYGPRFLHSTGQYHKGGPTGGLHLQLLASERGALPIPGAAYGLGDLAYAQALGDRRALSARDRTCLSLSTGGDPPARVRQLARSIAADDA